MDFFKGQKLVKQKEFGKALSFFLNLENNENQDNRIYFYLGMICFELNNFNKSSAIYSNNQKHDSWKMKLGNDEEDLTWLI